MQIEDNVPIVGFRKSKGFNLNVLKPGQSVHFNLEDYKSETSMASSVRQQVSRANQGKAVKEFTTRKTETGIRVWRIAPVVAPAPTQAPDAAIEEV